jgi:hypothetical protein
MSVDLCFKGLGKEFPMERLMYNEIKGKLDEILNVTRHREARLLFNKVEWFYKKAEDQVGLPGRPGGSFLDGNAFLYGKIVEWEYGRILELLPELYRDPLFDESDVFKPHETPKLRR